jgi:aspartate aminotransferase
MPKIAPAPAALPASGIRATTERATARPGCLRLEIGEHCFDTPPHIVEAAARAARDGFTRYTPGQGLLPLREAIAAKLERVNGLRVGPGEVIVSHGAMSGLFATFAAILEPGDEVLLPDPGWPNWAMMVRLLGGVARGYPLTAARGFVPDPEAMAALIGPRTRAILVNSPSNPTGAVYPAPVLEALVELARRHDLWLISDECYDEMAFDAAHVSPARFDDDGRVVSVFSCSKTYAMTGWRVGYVAAPPALVPTLAKLQQPLLANVCSVSQKAAEAALTGPQDRVRAMRDFYRERREQALAMLAARGIASYRPQGAFYLMVEAGGDSTRFALDLLETRDVAVAPGAAFGVAAANHVRVALCVDAATLDEGLSAVLDAAAG